MHEIFELSKYKEKIKFDKIRKHQNGGFPQTRPKKFKLSNHFCQTHEIFEVGKYYKKIKIDKICGYQSGVTPLQTWLLKF